MAAPKRRRRRQDPVDDFHRAQLRGADSLWRNRQLNRWKLALARARTRCRPRAAAAMYVLMNRAYKTPGVVFVGYGARWRHCGHDQGRRPLCKQCGRERPDDYVPGIADEMAGKGGRCRATSWRAMQELVREGCVVRWPGSEEGGRTPTGRGHAAEYSPVGGEEPRPAPEPPPAPEPQGPPAGAAARAAARRQVDQLLPPRRGSPDG